MTLICNARLQDESSKEYNLGTIDKMARQGKQVGIDESNPDEMVRAVEVPLTRLMEEQGMAQSNLLSMGL